MLLSLAQNDDGVPVSWLTTISAWEKVSPRARAASARPTGLAAYSACAATSRCRCAAASRLGLGALTIELLLAYFGVRLTPGHVPTLRSVRPGVRRPGSTSICRGREARASAPSGKAPGGR
jgi:hypothetical protein